MSAQHAQHPTTAAALCLLLLAAPGCNEIAQIQRSVNGSSNPKPASREPQPVSEPAIQVTFTRSKGAPELAPLPVTDVTAFDIDDALPAGLEKVGYIVAPQKGFPTAEDPHRVVGIVFLRGGGANAAWGAKVGYLRAEAGKHGANAIVSKGCKTSSEPCAALAFRLSTASPPAARVLTQDEAIVAEVAAKIPGATFIMNKNSTGGGPPTAAQTANRPAAEAVLAAIAAGPPNKGAAIPNNKALIAGLMAVWMPKKGSPSFDREVLRSVLYVETVGGKPNLTQEGLLMALTDEKSATPGVVLVAVPGQRLLELAAQNKIGVYVHYEGDASVFTGLSLDRIAEILPPLGKKTK